MKSLLLVTTLLATSLSWAACTQPEYTICSITIGSDNEIKYIKQLITGTDSGVQSADGCINFHEFVPPASQFASLRPDNQPWVDDMLTATPNINGAPGSLRTNCSFIVLSGHHDFGDNSGACDYTTNPRCKRRSQYIYKGAHNGNASTHFYKYEHDGYQGSSGPLLDLSRLMKSQAVCGDYTKTGQSVTTSDSGGALLGPDLLGVFLFACNMMRDEAGNYSAFRFPRSNYAYSSVAPNPPDLYSWTTVSYKKRSEIMFGNAVAYFGFDSTAPVGSDMYRRVGRIQGQGYLVEFLGQNLKQGKYGNHPDFMTCYLDDLKMYKAGLPNSMTSRCSVLNSTIALPSVSKAFCSSRIDVDCSCVKAGGIADPSDETTKDCMQSCVLAADQRVVAQAQKQTYCGHLRGFFGQMNREQTGAMATETMMTTGRKKYPERNLCRMFETPTRKYQCDPTRATVNCTRTSGIYYCDNPSKLDYDSLF